MADRKHTTVARIAVDAGIADPSTVMFYERLHAALSVQFGRENVDSGIGLGSIDFWIRNDGTEYVLNVKRKTQ